MKCCGGRNVFFSSANNPHAGGALSGTEGRSGSSGARRQILASTRLYDFGPFFEKALRSEWCIPVEGDPVECFGLEKEINVGPLLTELRMNVSGVGKVYDDIAANL